MTGSFANCESKDSPLQGLEDGLDFAVQGEVGGGDAVDGELRATERGEVKEAADVIVLVKGREEAFGFGSGEREGGERDRLTELPGKRQIALDEFGQRHDGGRTSGLSAHGRECTAGGGGSRQFDRLKLMVRRRKADSPLRAE